MTKPTRIVSPNEPALKSSARQYLESFGIAIVLALVMRASFVQAYMIPSGSMEPTLQVGDHILVNKIVYGLRIPDTILGLRIPGLPLGKYLCHFGRVHRGDIVVFVAPYDRGTDLIKRVIGVPGDRVEVRHGTVWLNGAPMADAHAHFLYPTGDRFANNPRDNLPEVIVPPGKFFMMGDNRDNSYDSRFWGFANETDIEGRAMVIFLSLGHEGSNLLPIRWDRFGRVLD